MSKFLLFSLFAFVASAHAYDACNLWTSCDPVVRMPEPSAIPELLVGAAGLGIYAWRKHRSAQ